jgi:hypothetical protein
MKIPFSQANPRIWLRNKAMYATTSFFLSLSSSHPNSNDPFREDGSWVVV